MNDFPLSFYASHRNDSVIHLVRQFSDNGDIYIFCNRYMGQASGAVIPMSDTKRAEAFGRPICANCQTAIETAIERFSVLQGLRPGQFQEIASKLFGAQEETV